MHAWIRLELHVITLHIITESTDEVNSEIEFEIENSISFESISHHGVLVHAATGWDNRESTSTGFQ